MQNVLLVIQIVVSVILIGLIMLQVKGTGFGRVWGGLSVSSSRRGLEGIVFKFTFIMAFLFISISVLSLII